MARPDHDHNLTAVPKFSDHQRRLRLARRHHLAPSCRSDDVREIAASLVGLHATDPASVFLAARARMPSMKLADLEAALYEDRTLLKVLGMRRTMFVVPLELAPVLIYGCALPLVPGETRKLENMVAEAGVTDRPEQWVERVMAETEEALQRRGPSLANELSSEIPELATRLSFGEGKTWAGTMGLSTRILFLLATAGRIVRSRPRGSWLSSQYRWVTIADWLERPLPPMAVQEARVQLASRWLAAYGPATVDDFKWWSGWTVAQTRTALEGAGAIEVDLETSKGVVLPGDLDPDEEVEHSAWFLPALDSTVMGWKEREWYLGPYRPLLFDTNGNAGPTIWWEGRVVGGWGQRPGGKVVYRLLEEVGSGAMSAIAEECDRLDTWLEGTRVIPRFRTPLEKELAV